MRKLLKIIFCISILFSLYFLTGCNKIHNLALDLRYEIVNLKATNGFEIIKEKDQLPVIKGRVVYKTQYVDMEDYLNVPYGIEIYIMDNLDVELYSHTTRRYLRNEVDNFYLIADYGEQITVAYKVEITKDESIKEFKYIFDVDGYYNKYGTLEANKFLDEPDFSDNVYNKEGYEFIGWSTSESPDDIISFPYQITEDITFYAIYEVKEYDIIYILNGGQFTETAEQKYVYNEDCILVSPQKLNYIFEGWYLDSEFSQEVQCIEPGTIGNINLYAKWTKQGAIFRENGYKYMYLGYYPQTVVDNNAIIEELVKLTTTNELGYYEYKGEQYAKVVAKPKDDGYIFINGKKVIQDRHYYFKVEPIKWRVISESTNSYQLLSEYILDAKAYYKTEAIRQINGKTIYSNNYAHSDIRTWLNNEFYNIAFTQKEKNDIIYTNVDNSSSTTSEQTYKYVCENTKDKVYLLSYKDLLNTSYGFDDYYNAVDVARKAIVSDYACANGCFKSSNGLKYLYGIWFLRSPESLEDLVSMVSADGGVGVANVTHSEYGVRPTIQISK